MRKHINTCGPSTDLDQSQGQRHVGREEADRCDPKRIRSLWARAYSVWHFSQYGEVPRWVANRVPSWDGGRGQDGRTYTSVWPKVADYCRRGDLDPATLIASLISISSRAQHDRPYPSRLVSERVRFVYDRVLERRSNGPQLVMDQQLAVLRADRLRLCRSGEVSPVDAELAVLRDPFSRLQPLFRYCNLMRHGDGDVASRYEDKAFSQYADNPDGYDACWRDLVPMELRDRYDRWIGGGSPVVRIKDAAAT